MTISFLIADFLKYLKLERNISKLTIRNYSYYLKHFLEFAGDIKPSDIDLNLIRKYKHYLAQKSLKRVTQNYFLIALRAFLRYLARIDVNTLSPEKVELGENEPKPLKVLDDTQLKQLLEAPDISLKNGLRDRCILEVLFSTGLRVSELARLNIREVMSLSDSAVLWLDRYMMTRHDSFKPLFIRYQGKIDMENGGEAMRLTPRSIERIVEKYVKALGLSVKATPHTLRHSFQIYTHITKC